MKKQIDVQRAFSASEIAIKDQNLLEISFASSEPYLRTEKDYTFNQILIINEDTVDFRRLIDQRSPLLLQHDAEKVIGVCEKCWIEQGRLKALVRFSENEKPQQILADVKSGIRRNVSFGYMIKDYKIQKVPGQPDNLYVTRFEPYEVSIVGIPADPTVGYGRSLNKEINMDQKELKETEELEETDAVKAEETANQTVEEQKEVVETEVPAEQVKAEETVADTATEQAVATEQVKAEETAETEDEEKDQTDDILALGELSDEQQLAKEAIKNNRSLKEFKQMILNKKNNKNLNVKEQKKMDKKYNICNAIRKFWKGDVDAAYEMEVSQQLTRDLKNTEYDFAFKPATRSFGDALVNTDYLPKEYVEMYRPATVLEQAGYTAIPSDGQSISFAVQTSGVVAQMLTLDGEAVSGEPSYALKTLTPHKCAAFVTIPYSLILQARPEIQALIEVDIIKGINEVRDAQAFIGTGANGQIKGIFNTTGINEIASGAAYTFSGVVSAETMIRASNNYNTNLTWVMNAKNYGKYKSTLKDTSVKGDYLIDAEGKMNGYKVLVCNQLTDKQIVLGDFSDLVVTDFRGISVKVDDITEAKKSAVKLICHAEFDMLVRKPKSFSIFKF